MSDIYKSPEAELHNPVSSGEYGSIENAITGQYHFRIRELMKEAWGNLKGLKTNVWLGFIMIVVVSIGLVFIMGLVMQLFAQTGDMTIVAISGIIQQLIIMLITVPMGAGIFMIALKHSVNTPTSFSEVFNYFPKTGKLLLLYIVMNIFILIGILLLVLPGIYLAFAYMMAIPLVVEKNMGIWEAMETSRKAITKKWFRFFGLYLLLSVILFVSMIPLGIGLIWSMPFFVLCYATLYRNMFGVEATTVNA